MSSTRQLFLRKIFFSIVTRPVLHTLEKDKEKLKIRAQRSMQQEGKRHSSCFDTQTDSVHGRGSGGGGVRLSTM